MLQPKKTKYRKQFKGLITGKASRGNRVDFGDFGLLAIQSGFLSSRQIEAARKVITRYTRKGGKMWIRIFPHKPITKKPAETRMGGGKGDIDHYVAAIKKGTVIFEIGGVSKVQAQHALRLATDKLPLKTKIIGRSR